MQPTSVAAAPARARRRVGLALSALPVLFLAFDAAIKLAGIEPVAESFVRLGWRAESGLAIGLLELACLVAYLVPRTAVLGAVLLTGYLGGAVATHARLGDPLLTHTLFAVYVGLCLWGGLLLRERRLAALVPLRARSG